MCLVERGVSLWWEEGVGGWCVWSVGGGVVCLGGEGSGVAGQRAGRCLVRGLVGAWSEVVQLNPWPGTYYILRIRSVTMQGFKCVQCKGAFTICQLLIYSIAKMLATSLHNQWIQMSSHKSWHYYHFCHLFSNIANMTRVNKMFT